MENLRKKLWWLKDLETCNEVLGRNILEGPERIFHAKDLV